MTRRRGKPLSKTKRRAQLQYLFSQGRTKEAQKLLNRPSPKQVKASLQKSKAEPIGTKGEAPSKTKEKELVSKAKQTVATTKESEPFKPHKFQESNYEKWRQWIEDNGYSREEAESLMQGSGQPLNSAQQAVLDEFEADGAFSDVEEEIDFETKRLTA